MNKIWTKNPKKKMNNNKDKVINVISIKFKDPEG